ncbi:hypothetical protein OS493_035543 [Desmophyllum pertusum]|uniref:Uncharacterized protein n=1 Tax=Desmophyllum pertusum TaxID=174260 RepID=A0A9X0CCR7_9CNID|nr:hypothetical protein OS493_035543 [Desmophyllum pertusum]
MADLEELSEFQQSNLINQGLPLQAINEPEMTMIEAIPYFADDNVNEAELQGLHPFQYKCRKQVEWNIIQLTAFIWNKENCTRHPEEINRIEKNAARTLYKIASHVNYNKKPRLGAQQPLKASYVPRLLALGDYHPYYKHLSKRRRDNLKYYLSVIKDHFKVRDELKKTVPLDQQKYHYF